MVCDARQVRPSLSAVVLGCWMLAASCSSADTNLAVDSGVGELSAPSTTSTTPPTSPLSTSTIQPSTTAPITPGGLAQLAIQAALGSWGEAQFLGEFDAYMIVGQLTASRSLLVVEQRGTVEEGCEGGIEPLGRLVLTNLDTGSSTTLLSDLELTDSRFVLGPNDRIAVIGGCDANAWLAAVGRIDAGGSLAFGRLSAEPADRVNASNNAGVSVTWTSDGSVLFIDSTRVDADTGDRLDPDDPAAVLRVHAELADGTRLVSTAGGDSRSRFWIVDSDVSLQSVPEASPDLVAQAGYPAVQVRIGAERGYATFEDWDASTTQTVMFGRGGLSVVDGRVEPSPTGTRLLVQTGDAASGEPRAWTVVDLTTNTSRPVTLPLEQTDNWITVQWGASDDELLVTAQPNLGVAPTSVWLVNRN